MNIGISELAIIFGIVIAIFGAGKVPAAAKDIASGIKEIRSAKDKILK